MNKCMTRGAAWLVALMITTQTTADNLHLSAARLVGSATEGKKPIEMTELRPEGTPTGIYEAYMKASAGQFTVMGITADGKDSLMLGQGTQSTEVRQGGTPFTIGQEQVVRVRLDAHAGKISILPVTLCLKGNIVKEGTTLQYAGHGVWKFQVEMNEGNVFLFSDKFFYLAFNNNDSLAVKRLRSNRNGLGMPSEGYKTENIRINRGTYMLTVDMARHTWDIDAPIDENRISAFGSSVCNGEGATDHKGYAYMYGQQLAERFSSGKSKTPFTVSGVAIGGNTTVNLLNRYDEMIHDFGRYVIIGLSMGNEGVHEAKDKQAVFRQFQGNMLTLIDKCRKDGKVPVIMNNYTRGDYNEQDYDCVKKMNLDIHQWEVPSVNVLGAIDNGEGKWADGYMRDNYHQDTEGHREFMYAIPPSLFDALKQGKGYPARCSNGSLALKNRETLRFCGEGTVHPFTVTLKTKGKKAGQILLIHSQQGDARLSVLGNKYVRYISSTGDTLISSRPLITDADSEYDLTVTHYYAQKRTLVYVNEELVGEVKERISPTLFTIGDGEGKQARSFSELSFWRSGMTPEEIAAHHQGICLKSSLEIYTPLNEEMKASGFTNLAQSLNSSLRWQAAGKTGKKAKKH